MNMASRRSMAGLTLIEVLVVSVIVAILAAIAVPAYQQQVREGRRVEARGMLVEVMNREHRWFADNSAYTTDVVGDLDFDPAESENGYYTVIAAGTEQQVVLTADVTSKGGQDEDTACTTLTLSTTGAKTPIGDRDKCW